jgi:hypothetical protein
MKVVIVYKNESDHARHVLDFLRDFERQTGRTVETLDPETTEGELFCRAYDIVEYPTVIAISDDSVMQNMWRGLPLPTISEVSYYA